MEQQGTLRVGVIGGGMAGLTAAYELAKRGCRVAVFERDTQLGGQAGTFAVNGTLVERFYHHLFTSDRHIAGLMAELGIADRLRWRPSRMGIFHGGRPYPFGTPLDLVRFSPLSLLDRLRFGLIVVYLGRYKNWRRLEAVTAKDWLLKYGGRSLYDVIYGPLLRGKFGESHERVSMTWFWGKIYLRGQSRSGGGGMKELLGYPEGSFQVIIDALEQAILRLGGTIHRGAAVQRVVVSAGRATGLQVQLAPGDEPAPSDGVLPFDRVIATTPSHVFIRLVPELPAAYLAKLRGIDYLSAVCLTLQLRHPLSSIYWMNVTDRSMPFVGVIEHTNFIPADVYGGTHLVYVSNYLSRDHPLYKLAPEELLQAYLPALKRINPAFSEDWIEAYRYFKDDAGQPVVVTNYSALIPEHETGITNLYLANTTQIYPEDRGTNYSVRLGQRIADLALRAG
jgi:protoporphyrinogen oxidase